jgi:hypothetical protein
VRWQAGDGEEGRKEKKKKHRQSEGGDSGSNSPVSKKVKA